MDCIAFGFTEVCPIYRSTYIDEDGINYLNEVLRQRDMEPTSMEEMLQIWKNRDTSTKRNDCIFNTIWNWVCEDDCEFGDSDHLELWTEEI